MSEIDLLIQVLRDTIDNQKEEIDRLKDLCNKYEEEHKTAFKLWTQKMEEIPDYEESMKLKKEVVRLNNIINEIKEYLKYQVENLDFEKDTKAKMLGSMILVMLDKEELKENNKNE